MPEISRFFGIVVYMYFDDHNPPHFHAKYGGNEVIMTISDLRVIKGSLSQRATALVREWATAHQPELLLAWQNAKEQQDPGKIAPLE